VSSVKQSDIFITNKPEMLIHQQCIPASISVFYSLHSIADAIYNINQCLIKITTSISFRQLAEKHNSSHVYVLHTSGYSFTGTISFSDNATDGPTGCGRAWQSSALLNWNKLPRTLLISTHGI